MVTIRVALGRVFENWRQSMKKGKYRKVAEIFEPDIPKTKFQKEKRIVINGLKKLNKKELKWLSIFIKADIELNFGLSSSLIENAIREINSKHKK